MKPTLRQIAEACGEQRARLIRERIELRRECITEGHRSTSSGLCRRCGYLRP